MEREFNDYERIINAVKVLALRDFVTHDQALHIVANLNAQLQTSFDNYINRHTKTVLDCCKQD